jgi:hypothetical protein
VKLVNFLKENMGSHMAMQIWWCIMQNKVMPGAAENDTDWIAEQHKGKENLKPWYDKIMSEISNFGKDIEVSPKKAYEFEKKKQFAILQPSTKDRFDVGLNIKVLRRPEM